MDTTDTTHYITFGPAAHGGKIHRSDEYGQAWCLSGSGHKRLFRVVAKSDMTWAEGFVWSEATQEERKARFATMEANERAALAKANVPASGLCKKCCGHLIAAA
jgi:hypothetical protein